VTPWPLSRAEPPPRGRRCKNDRGLAGQNFFIVLHWTGVSSRDQRVHLFADEAPQNQLEPVSDGDERQPPRAQVVRANASRSGDTPTGSAAHPRNGWRRSSPPLSNRICDHLATRRRSIDAFRAPCLERAKVHDSLCPRNERAGGIEATLEVSVSWRPDEVAITDEAKFRATGPLTMHVGGRTRLRSKVGAKRRET